MSFSELPKNIAQQAIDSYYKNGKNAAKAAIELNISPSTIKGRLLKAKSYGLSPRKEFITDPKTQRILSLERELGQLKAINQTLSEKTTGLEEVKELIHKTNVPARPPKWIYDKGSKSSTTTSGTPILFCSDFHYDEVVHPAEIHGVNAYNRVIAQRRIKTLFTQTVDLLINRVANHKYDKIVVAFGGDLLSGNIHEELRETNEAPIAKSIISLVDTLSAGLLLLLDHFDKVEIRAIPGNHGRWDRKPRYKNRVFDNYEWLLLQMLMRQFRGEDRIYFDISDGPDLAFNVYDTRYLMTHGDQFKGGSGISGVLAPLMLGDHRKRKRSMAINKPYDYLMMGHFHQMLFVKGIIVNGSLKGYDEYAFQNNFEFELPIQSLWITSPVWGITSRWPIYLEKPGVQF